MFKLFLIFNLIFAIFSQNYNNGGDNWNMGVCNTGSMQSPIELVVPRGFCDDSMVFDLQLVNSAVLTKILQNDSTIYSNGVFSNLYATDISGNLYGYVGKHYNLLYFQSFFAFKNNKQLLS